jgi:hypothetical protein
MLGLIAFLLFAILVAAAAARRAVLAHRPGDALAIRLSEIGVGLAVHELAVQRAVLPLVKSSPCIERR